MIDKILYEKLKEVAKKGMQNNREGIIHYEDVMLLAGLDRENPADREIKLRDTLDDINREEHENGRPMITAVVVHKQSFGKTQMPGDGFFKLALYLGKWDGKGNKEKFWINEIRKVWNYWGKTQV